MNEAGYYKFVNGEWVRAANGIILPHTTEATTDPKILEENGWEWFDEIPTNVPENYPKTFI